MNYWFKYKGGNYCDRTYVKFNKEWLESNNHPIRRAIRVPPLDKMEEYGDFVYGRFFSVSKDGSYIFQMYKSDELLETIKCGGYDKFNKNDLNTAIECIAREAKPFNYCNGNKATVEQEIVVLRCAYIAAMIFSLLFKWQIILWIVITIVWQFLEVALKKNDD